MFKMQSRPTLISMQEIRTQAFKRRLSGSSSGDASGAQLFVLYKLQTSNFVGAT